MKQRSRTEIASIELAKRLERYDELSAAYEKALADLKRKREAIRVSLDFLREADSSGEQAEAREAQDSTVQVRECLEEIVSSMNADFQIGQVLTRLEEEHPEVAWQSRMPTVSATLKRLATEGVLEVISPGRKGRGNMTVYRYVRRRSRARAVK